MRIGVLVPTRAVVMESARRPPVETCWTMARLADQAGYDAVWVGDSIVAKPRLEPLTSLVYLAGITTRVRLGTAVLLPALRHPVVLAHQIANVDQISRGRLVIGLGVGWSLPSAAPSTTSSRREIGSPARARVGGVRRGPQTPRPSSRRAREDLAHALAWRAGHPPKR